MQLLANATSPYARIVRVAMIEKGLDLEPTIVDPWADDPRLRAANAATRVPTLILDDGTPLAESLLIVQWLEQTRPAPAHPSLFGSDPTGVLSRAGIACPTRGRLPAENDLTVRPDSSSRPPRPPSEDAA